MLQEVRHAAKWRPKTVQVDKGSLVAGYSCVHELENGDGQCGLTTVNPFEVPAEEHFCTVYVEYKFG